jgi:hypothetical protein
MSNPYRAESKDLKINLFEEPVPSTNKLTEPSTWSRKMILFMICLVSFVILIPLTFTVIIPSFIRDSCEESEITVSKATFIHPSDTTFQTSIDLKFSTGVSISSKVALDSLKVTWDEIGGGSVMKLKQINNLEVITSKQTLDATVHVTNLTALTDFASSIMISETFELKMKGDAVVTVIVPTDVTLKKSSQLYGFSNWTSPARIPTLNITDGTTDYLAAMSLSELYSTSNVEIIFGQNVYYKLKVGNDVLVGIGKFSNFTLFTGNFSDISTIQLSYSTPEEYNGLMYLIGNYMSRVDTPVVVNEMYLERPVQWLLPALADIEIHAVLPGLTSNLIVYTDMYVSVRNPLKVPFTLTLFNPLPVTVTVDALDADIYYQGVLIATVDATNLQVVIPPGGQVTTQEIESQVDPRETSTVLDLLSAGYGLIDCVSITTLYIVEFKAVVNYFQNNISAYVHSRNSAVEEVKEEINVGEGIKREEEGMAWREEEDE